MKCENQEKADYCPCTWSCEKHQKCCLCIKYHRDRKELPACYFPPKAERTGDRSFKNFIKHHKEL
ncbi:MAG: DUF6485 family protein [Candidatus Hodarchaeota archaeon]